MAPPGLPNAAPSTSPAIPAHPGLPSDAAPARRRDRARTASATPASGGGGALWAPVALVWLLMVVPPLAASLAVGALVVAVYPKVTLILIFLVFVVLGLWAHVLGAVRVARAGATTADLRRHAIAHATGTDGAYDATDSLDAFARALDGGPRMDAARALPALERAVGGVVAELGIPAPSVEVARGGFVVVAAPDGSALIVGSAYLLVASEAEVRAEVARLLSPLATDRSALRALDAARAAVVGARWRPPQVSSRLDLLWWPAGLAAGAVERLATATATSLRAQAAATAERTSGLAAARTAAERSAVLPQLWRDHVRAGQLAWSQTGAPVVPHETWVAAWTARLESRAAVAIDPADASDLVAAVGWPPLAHDSGPVPRAAAPPALEALAGEDAPRLLRSFDDLAASQYYEPSLNERFGAAAPAFVEEAPPAPVAPLPAGATRPSLAPGTPLAAAPPDDLPLAPDASSPHPALGLILRQLDVLHEELGRRDACSLATARAIEAVAEAPTVRTMAAALRWLSGDPDGPAALRRALADAPHGAGALTDLVPALRAAGESALATEVQQAIADLERILLARYDLRKMWGRAPGLQAPQLPRGVLAALEEIAAAHPADTRVYVAEVDVPTGPLRPTVLVRLRSFWTLRPSGDPTGLPGPVEELVRLVWPAMRIIGVDEIEARGRKALRKRFTRLERTSR